VNEAGLTEKWRRRFQRDGNRCIGNEKEKGRKTKKHDQRITLKNMSGSFVILVVGIFSSVIVFLTELIIRRRESTAIAVLIVPKTDAGANTIISTVRQLIMTDNKLNNVVAADDNAGPDDSESSIVVISSPVPITDDLKTDFKIAVSNEISEENKKALIVKNDKMVEGVTANEVITNTII